MRMRANEGSPGRFEYVRRIAKRLRTPLQLLVGPLLHHAVQQRDDLLPSALSTPTSVHAVYTQPSPCFLCARPYASAAVSRKHYEPPAYLGKVEGLLHGEVVVEDVAARVMRSARSCIRNGELAHPPK